MVAGREVGGSLYAEFRRCIDVMVEEVMGGWATLDERGQRAIMVGTIASQFYDKVSEAVGEMESAHVDGQPDGKGLCNFAIDVRSAYNHCKYLAERMQEYRNNWEGLLVELMDTFQAASEDESNE